MTFGVDLAWGRPSIKALQAAGVLFVCRYLSHDTTGKNLDRAEAEAYSSAGIWVVVVWESTASRALDGYGAGAQDARDAESQAASCGMPSGRPIYFAVDFDAGSGDQAAINSYLDGAASVLGHERVGVYGSYDVVGYALDHGHATYGWQTYAWSGGQWDPRAQLQQYSNDHIIDGVGLDYDRATKDDYGQWRVGVSPGPNPNPNPPPQQEDDVPYGQLASGAQAITPISLPQGKYAAIGFIADNGLAGKPAVKLRVAVRIGPDNWEIHPVTVDSAASSKTVVVFAHKATTDGISVRREDAGDVPVAWDVS